MGVQKLDENLSLYSKDNLTTLYNDVSGNSDSLMSYAKEGSRTKIRDFGQEYLKKVVENFDHNGVMKEKPNQNMDFGNINKKDEKEVIKVRTDFFQDYFLPFLKNPGDMKTEISLEEYEQVGNQKDEWISCFGKDKKDEEVKKSLEYRDEWYEFSKKEIRRIIEKSGGEKKDKSNNDSYGDHEEVFSKDDRYEAAKKRIEKLQKKYDGENNNILKNNKEDYSTTKFLKLLDEFLGKSDNNPLGSDSNLQKFLDANLSQLKKVLGSGALGGKENSGGDGEENYLKNLQKEASSDKASKKVKEIYNVKKVLLQYLFDMANMDLNFCYGKIKIYSKSNEGEEDNDDEDENENSDNGIFSKIAIGLKMGSEYIKGKLQQGYGTLIKNFYDIDSYDNYCGFLVNMISNLGNQIEDIGAVNVDSEDKEEEKTSDENKNEETSAGEDRRKKEIFYDPYWYIDYLSKSEGKDKEKDHKNAKKLKNFYLERAKFIKLYEYLGDEKNFDVKKIVKFHETVDSKEQKVRSKKLKNVKEKDETALAKVRDLGTLQSSNGKLNEELINKMQKKYVDKRGVPRMLPKIFEKIVDLERDNYEKKCFSRVSKQISETRKQIKEVIDRLTFEIKVRVIHGKEACERDSKNTYALEEKLSGFLAEANEFASSKEEFEKISFISEEDYYKSTGESVLCDLDDYSKTLNSSIKEIENKLLKGDQENDYFQYSILSEATIKKAKKINEKKFPTSYKNIDSKLDKYFNDNSELLKTEKEKKLEKEKEEEKQKLEKEEKDAKKVIDDNLKNFKTIDLQKKQKIDLTKLQGIDENERKKLEAKNEEIEKYNKKIDDYIKEKETMQNFFGLKLKKVGSIEIDEDKIIKANNEKKEAEKKRIEEENRKKEEEKKAKEAEARNTPEKFLKYLNENFGVKKIEDLKIMLVDNKKDDKNKDKFKKIYEKLKNRYEELKQKESEKAAEAFKKALDSEAPPKKLLRDFYTPKESYKIDSLLFAEKEESRISYDKYVIMANDENPSPRRYLNFLGMRDISELEVAYKNFATYSNAQEYEKNLNYYKEQYKEASEKATKGSVVAENENKVRQLNSTNIHISKSMYYSDVNK